MNSSPTTATENLSTGTTSIPTWFIGTTVGCSFAFLILGIIIGVFIQQWYGRRRTTNNQDPRILTEESQFLLNESPAAHSNNDVEDVSPEVTNDEFHGSSDRGQIMQTHGHLSEASLTFAEALPHNPGEVPLKGSIRALDPEYYEEKFRVLGFRNKYEPNVEPNCLFEAITKARNCGLADDDVVKHAKFMRHRVVHFIEQSQAQFRDSIASLSSTVEEYLKRLKNPTQPCDDVVIHAIALMEKLSIQLVHVDGIGNMFHCSSDQDQRKVIYIGHVEKNYFLLLEPTWERRDGDSSASSNRLGLPVSDSRVESNGQSVSNRAEGTDGQQPSVLPLLGQFDTILEMDMSDDLEDDVNSGTSQAYDSDSTSGDDEDDLEERMLLSENLIMFPRQKLAQHRNVVAGEIRSTLPDQNRPCVIKFDSNQVIREITALLKLGSHSNIVNLIDSGFLSDPLSTQYIVLHRYHDLNLEDYVLCDHAQPLYDINRGFKFCRQIIDGMKFIHEKLIIHKDLKPSNILLSDNLENAVIADFGSSQEVNSTLSMVRSYSIFGTLGYRPPESLDMSYVSLKSDNYSLGAVFYFLLSKGKSLFGLQSDSWDHNTKHGRINISGLLVRNPLAMKHLLVSMTNKERCRRPSIQEIEYHPCWSGREYSLNFNYHFEQEFETHEDISSTEEIGNPLEDGLGIWRTVLKFYKPVAISVEAGLGDVSYGPAPQGHGQQTEKFYTDDQTPPASEAGSGTDAQELSDIEQQLQKDLEVFEVEEQKKLREMNMPHALHDALYSQDCLAKMCRRWYLEVTISDLREFLRRYALLKDITIKEILHENGSNSSEIKYQFLNEMLREQGEKLNPKVLFEKILDFKKLVFYDDLFRYFVEILKSNNSNQNNS